MGWAREAAGGRSERGRGPGAGPGGRRQAGVMGAFQRFPGGKLSSPSQGYKTGALPFVPGPLL